MGRKKSWTNEQMLNAINNSVSIAQVCKKLNLKMAGSNYYTINNFVKTNNIDVEHWTGQGHLKGKKRTWGRKADFKDILVENGVYTNMSTLKQRLLRENLLENKCYICGLKEHWNGKPIVLVLDHINGKHFDHRLNNLRLLCPNCDSQTETFKGRNRKIQKIQKEKYFCIKCGKKLNQKRKTNSCIKCMPRGIASS